MKKLLNLEGVKALSKTEQKSVFGGYDPLYCTNECESSSDCFMQTCKTTTCLGHDNWKYCG